MGKYYHLYKISAPGFHLCSTDINNVHRILSCYICGDCLKTIEESTKEITHNYNTNPQLFVDYIDGNYVQYTLQDALDMYVSGVDNNYDTMSVDEQIDEMLSTACGCEFTLQRAEDIKCRTRSLSQPRTN